MGDDDRREGPSLELPSFRLGRRRRARPEAPTDPGDRAAEGAEVPEEATARFRTEPRPAPEPAAPSPAPSAAPPPAQQPVEPPLFVDEAATAPLPRSPLGATSATETAPEPELEETEHKETGPGKTAPRRAVRRRPRLGGLPAAVLTGVVVGLLAVVLTWASQRGCSALRGTSTCGGGPGFLLLLAIMVAMIFLGAGLLRVFGVPGPGSTSFLGMGLLAVITLLFFVDVVFDWWMAIVVPICAGLTYALSQWVTSTYAEPDR